MLQLISLSLLPYDCRMNPASDKSVISRSHLVSRDDYQQEYRRLIGLVKRREVAFNKSVQEHVGNGSLPVDVQWLGPNAIHPDQMPYELLRKARLLQSACDAADRISVCSVASRQFI